MDDYDCICYTSQSDRAQSGNIALPADLKSTIHRKSSPCAIGKDNHASKLFLTGICTVRPMAALTLRDMHQLVDKYGSIFRPCWT